MKTPQKNDSQPRATNAAVGITLATSKYSSQHAFGTSIHIIIFRENSTFKRWVQGLVLVLVGLILLRYPG